MSCGKIAFRLLLTTPWWLAAAMAATPAAVAPAAKNAPAPLSLDNWQDYMQMPVTPSRSNIFQGDAGEAAATIPKPEAPASSPAFTPLIVSTKPASQLPLAVKPKPGSNDDRLAAIAIEDRDFFAALTKNPQTWPESERDRRAQHLHDEYWLYLAEYPADVNALVLYGKLLNRTGQRDAAFAAFLHADQLDPGLAVVKQQLANHLAENGSYTAALELFRKAVALAPGEALYHYEIGELLNLFYEDFLKDKIFDQAGINQTMEAEFGYAAALAPKVTAFAWRHAICYYDMLDPDWNAALKAWEALAKKTTDVTELDVIRLHRARILTQLARYEEARQLLAQPVQQNLEAVRVALSQRLEKAAAPKPPAGTTPTAP